MKIRRSDIAVILLLLWNVAKFSDFQFPFTTPSYVGMTAVAIVENMDTDFEVLKNLAELPGEAEARGLKWRKYDDDQESAKELLEQSGASSPAVLIHDGTKVIKSLPMPIDFDDLGEVLEDE